MMKFLVFITLIFLFCYGSVVAEKKPNIVLAIADDWGYPHAGSYGEESIKTPTFDSIAAGGFFFEHAYVSSPSCTPSRGSILSGQHHWRLEEGANLWGTINSKILLYTDILRKNGYLVGHSGKGWGPGNYRSGGRQVEPAGKKFESFSSFLKKRKEGQPFCFWFGSQNPHRPYELGSGKNSGIDINKIELYKSLPDHPTIRKDVADYLLEVQKFDEEVGKIVKQLKDLGEYRNTIFVMTGDHGMPFPRCKGNLYDSGTRVPLAISYGDKKTPVKTSTFVSLTDLAPTFLEAAGVKVPQEMTGKSLWSFISGKTEKPQGKRDYVVFGRERHTLAQEYPSKEGYPCRGIRTEKYLLIKNFKPDLWPAGVPNNSTRGVQFSDCDYGPSKQFLLKNRDDASVLKYYVLSFHKRPKFELYDLEKDPDQLVNLANDEEYDSIRSKLLGQLKSELQKSSDPRLNKAKCKFNSYEYYGRKRKMPK